MWMVLAISGPALAQDLSPDFKRSITLSRQHADSPTGWVPNPIAGDKPVFTITGNPATENAEFGLKYDSAYGDGKDYLIVRTLSKSAYYTNNTVNQSGYQIYGQPTTAAAWVTTGNEATGFLRQNGGTSANVVKLLERGLGMNDDGSHTAVVEYAVIADNDHILRPTKNPNIREYSTIPGAYGTNAAFAAKPNDMTQTTYENYVGTATQKGYYQYWKEKAYDSAVKSGDAFPWSQIGYTFLWGNGEENLADIQGMSEFILPGGASVQIYGLYSPQSYIYTLNKNGEFSSDADAQYGNGFAGFKVTGSCDTIWAGHRFQRNVSTGSANRIDITPGGILSGGQGLLVWSLNYVVDNQGSISGATANKFATSDTENIAILFKGDTTAYGCVAAPTGSNTLTNSGTISSPGIAVKAEAGDTNIINSTGGVISGGTYAIRTGAGNDTVTVAGGEISGQVDLGTGTDKFDVNGAEGHAKLSFNLSKDTAASAQVLVKDVGGGMVNIADNTRVAVTMSGAKLIQSNDRFLIVDTNTLTVNPANLAVQNDSSLPMVGFSATQDGNSLYLVAERDRGYYGANSGNASLGALLDTLANSATGDMADVLGDLDKSGDAGNARKLEPNVYGAAMQTTYGMMNKYTDAVTNRIEQVLAGRAAGEGKPGIATGDEPARSGVWLQGFRSDLHQDSKGTSNGYDAGVWGTVFGFDKYVFETLLLGLSGGYARSEVTTSDSDTGMDADSYQAGLYGNLVRGAYYIDAVLSYGYNRYDDSRHIAFGTTNRIAKSNYGGHQYFAYLEGGYAIGRQGLAVTPLVSVQYMRLHLNDYKETGAGDLNLHVDSQDYDLFQTGLGAKISYPILRPSFRIIPEIHGKWLYDFAGDQQQVTSTFTGGGASFITKGCEQPKSSGNVGAKLTLMTKHSVTFSLDYDYEWKEAFYSHSGYAAIRYDF